MQTNVKKPKRIDQIAKWPVLAFLMLMSGFSVPGHCLDRNPSDGGMVAKARAIWLSTGNLNTARVNHTATLLPNGKVLVVGGSTNDGNRLDSAELYDPATGTWAVTDRLNASRAGHTATLVPNGQVPVVGGAQTFSTLDTAELYDPATGTWTRTNPPAANRFDHTATLLQTGKVLIAGGASQGFAIGAELYDPPRRHGATPAI